MKKVKNLIAIALLLMIIATFSLQIFGATCAAGGPNSGWDWDHRDGGFHCYQWQTCYVLHHNLDIVDDVEPWTQVRCVNGIEQYISGQLRWMGCCAEGSGIF